MHQIRPVAPAEYDAAVRETPELCPLLLDGDRRSGSQARPAPSRPLGLRRSSWPGDAHHNHQFDRSTLFILISILPCTPMMPAPPNEERAPPILIH